MSDSLTLEQARIIIAEGLRHGRDAGMAPLAVVVLDDGGHLKAFEREDGASFGRYTVADGKAHGALALGIGSRSLGAAAEARPFFVSAVNGALDGRLVPVAGGVLVLDGERVVGAVGVSGDNSDNDEACAVAGIEAAGLRARPD